MFCNFGCLLTPKPTNQKIHNSLDSSRPYGKLLENQKERALGNYFCLKMISKLAWQKILQKSIQISEALKPTRGMKFRLEFFCTFPSTDALNLCKNCFGLFNRDIFKEPQVLVEGKI